MRARAAACAAAARPAASRRPGAGREADRQLARGGGAAARQGVNGHGARARRERTRGLRAAPPRVGFPASSRRRRRAASSSPTRPAPRRRPASASTCACSFAGRAVAPRRPRDPRRALHPPHACCQSVAVVSCTPNLRRRHLIPRRRRRIYKDRRTAATVLEVALLRAQPGRDVAELGFEDAVQAYH